MGYRRIVLSGLLRTLGSSLIEKFRIMVLVLPSGWLAQRGGRAIAIRPSQLNGYCGALPVAKTRRPTTRHSAQVHPYIERLNQGVVNIPCPYCSARTPRHLVRQGTKSGSLLTVSLI